MLRRTWAMDTMMTFGKHKDFTIAEIIELDPSYIDWMIQTFEGDSFDIEVTETLWSQRDRIK